MNNETHDVKVNAIAATMRERARKGEPLHHLAKKGVHHVVPLPRDKRFVNRPLDLSSLDQILDIDPVNRVCTAEPGVTFGRLVRATLEHGLIPTTVPELEGVTIGGAVAGCSVEAMSYKYGGFHDSCTGYELVTARGEVVTCSRDQEPLVFDMIHGSYGTLAVLTRLTFRLVPAKAYVRMTYVALPTVEAFHEEMIARCRAADHDLIDGIIHGPGKFVLCLGDFVDHAPYVSDYKWLNIYYKSTVARTEDYLPTWDYCFRYDAECHWLTRTVPAMEWKPVRFLVGKWLLGSTNLISTFKRLEPVFGRKRRPDVVCDVFIPSRNFPDFYRWYEKDFDFFPLWVVPYRMPKAYPWLSDIHAGRIEDEYQIDCAVYGRPNELPHVDYSELLERKTFELGGIKTLIGRNHYDSDRFWEIYHRENYEAVKRRLDPDGLLPHLESKFARV